MMTKGWVPVNRLWLTLDDDLSRLVRWIAASMEWRQNQSTPAGWARTTCAEIAELFNWGRTKAHRLLQSAVFEVVAHGRSGTLVRVRDTKRPPDTRVEQKLEQSPRWQPTEKPQKVSIVVPPVEQSLGTNARHPYIREEELLKNLSLDASANTHADSHARPEQEGWIAPDRSSWHTILASPLLVSGKQVTLAFCRPPSREELVWLTKQGMRYCRVRRYWTGALNDAAIAIIREACLWPEGVEADVRDTLRVALTEHGDDVWSTGPLSPVALAYLASLGGECIREHGFNEAGKVRALYRLSPSCLASLGLTPQAAPSTPATPQAAPSTPQAAPSTPATPARKGLLTLWQCVCAEVRGRYGDHYDQLWESLDFHVCDDAIKVFTDCEVREILWNKNHADFFATIAERIVGRPMNVTMVYKKV
jgi:hypothetical protein